MNLDETTAVLKTRRDLTGESFNDGTITAWCEALGAWPMTQVRTAVIGAAREHARVTVAHVATQLPQHHKPAPAPPPACQLCDATGWVTTPQARAHDPRTCNPTADRPCMCTAVEPCPSCTTGNSMRPAFNSILTHRARDQRPDALAPSSELW